MTPLLPLDSWRRVMGYNPWHFWGLAGPEGAARVTSGCDGTVKQHAWQNANTAGRAQIAQAIEHAETRLRQHLGYSPAPRYVAETVAWPAYTSSGYVRHGSFDAAGRWISVQLGEGHTQAVGIEARSLIGNAAVAYSDTDGDGLNDLATITIATSVTTTGEIAAYVATADRFEGGDTGAAISESWRIRPLRVSISGGIATIKGPAWLFVKPVLYEGIATSDLNPATAANFVTTVDIYRRYTDTTGTTNSTSQAMLIWETRPCGGWWCCGDSAASYTPADSSADPAAQALAVARVGIRNSRLGIVTPAEAAYNTTSGIWSCVRFDTGYEPDRVLVRHLSGLPLVNDQMDLAWQTIVARMAAAELATRICACDTANREIGRWQFDLARTSGANDESYGAISSADLNNPFGTRAGQVYAWKEVANLRILTGFLP